MKILVKKERQRERKRERERNIYLVCYEKCFVIFFLGILPLNSPHPPEGKWLLHPSQGSQTVDFFFIRKIFVHRIGLNLVLAKKNVLK